MSKSKLTDLEEKFEAKYAKRRKLRDELDKAKTILGKLKFDPWKEKDVIEKQISTIMHSQPKNFVKEKSYPFVLMDNCPHKPFWEAKEKNERAKRRELDQLENKNKMKS